MRFGEENIRETRENLDGVARNSTDLDETQEHVEHEVHEEANPGADEALGGYGSASLLECLGRLGAQPNTSTPATCHTEGGQGEAPPYQTDSLQVMSPNQGQHLPQDSAQVHNPSANPHVQSVDRQCKKEETSETKLEQEMFDFKETTRVSRREKMGQLSQVNLRSCLRSGPQTHHTMSTTKIPAMASAKPPGSML